MIKITDKYYADVDKYNWILCEKHIVTEEEAKKSKKQKAGDVKYKNPTYHMSFHALLVYVFEKRKKNLAKKDYNDIGEYIKEVEKLQGNFLEEIKKIKEVKM